VTAGAQASVLSFLDNLTDISVEFKPFLAPIFWHYFSFTI
jgi:hypothetical protein